MIELNGADVSAYSEDKLADMRLAELGFVFQFHFLLPEFSALENVMIPQMIAGVKKKEAAAHAENPGNGRRSENARR